MTPAERSTLQEPAALRRVLAKARDENFPVALRLLPAAQRGHLLALYAFARMVDDLGDEAEGDRLRLLDAVSHDLDRIYAGSPPPEPLYQRLSTTIYACGLPREPFERLVEANRRDQTVRRYATFGDLLGYCALSADPVGRLVLGVFGVATEERLPLSDRVCSALQVLEHCQDVAEDARAGRIYLPAEDLDRFGVAEGDLLSGRASREVRALVGYTAQRAVALLDEGEPLVGTLSGTARLAVAGYVAGGRATAVALAGAGFDVLATTPRPSKGRTIAEWVRLLVTGGAR
ncbi:squalene synthase HpnC [Prauserella sp. PE36]|uniref:Squalene synthase HpnC n=1 Tax=Prauserella endophytica TaxID=1592324 RepID=A0ABY2S5A6_9PSEU|nr:MULTISPECIES: squalene synthase HpnC [Prauserella]PXY30061.1 squalene synthase HpnC [Prauserella coralliicola]RBM12599.1 squalene synthase HpnC [Prauserella sp. PE36]TKG71123.1 squalene synthase HpnC [Prauserella endophytica]